ncbi:MAG: YbaB/EbfC family nucleoid-associated protein [Candidatus Bipolaricaulis sp.]|nr:YbaB/EbfC family nucleoid-associated protein [Candidatus Bipolaricaulis sp.]MDD5219089.1 YbaB/EbfC family nucleoid-associated protein [Candidatus Bipolaricaulis sp.]
MGNLANLGSLMKQAKKLQEDLERAQAEIAQLKVEATAGGGMVTATVSGRGELQQLKLEKEIVDPEDIEMLADLIVAAVQEAQRKAEEVSQEKLGPLAQGMGGMPGMLGL